MRLWLPLVAAASIAAGSITTAGFSVHWLDIDEHPSMLEGTRANTARLFMCWKYLQRAGRPSPIDLGLTLAEAKQNGDALAGAFLQRPELQAGLNGTARMIAALGAAGMKSFLSIGDGGANCLPQVVDASNTSAPPRAMDPNIVGSEAYLAHTYVLTRALVRRFGGSASAVQLGNELNYCWVAALGGEFHWAQSAGQEARAMAGPGALSVSGLGRLRELAAPVRDGTSWLASLIGQWGNATFMDRVVATLRAAVQSESASMPTSINYMVDVPRGFSDLAEMPHWTDLARREPWASASDVIAVDTYPNFVFASPVRGDIVAQRVQEAASLAGGKPVWVAETGIGVLAAGVAPGAPATAFTEANQAEYYAAAFDRAEAAGASGFFAFGWWRDEGIPAPPGGFSQEDAEALGDVAALYLNGTSAIPELAGFALAHPVFAATRLPGLVGNVSTHFGVFGPAGAARPAAGVLSQRFPGPATG